MEHLRGAAGIEAAFSAARKADRAVLVIYWPLGYPSPESSLAVVEAAVKAGADIVELGIPFSDPLADGPTIQRATQVALGQGMRVARCLESAAALRERGVQVPLLFMGYYNPILSYGEARFCRACRDAGVDGLIVPDLPPEEATGLEEMCRLEGLALVYLVAPTSSEARIRLIAQHSSGFVYLVSVTGTTGPRDALPPHLPAFVERVRKHTEKPLCVGFGISGPEQARAIAGLVDGVIVGSALLRKTEEPDSAALSAFVQQLREAVARRAGA